jgi:hypothetical protein
VKGDIEKVAEEFAEARISRLSLDHIEVGLAYDVSKTMAIEVLEFALPRLRGGSGE